MCPGSKARPSNGVEEKQNQNPPVEKQTITRAETSTHVGLGAKILGVDTTVRQLRSGRVPIEKIPEILARGAKILGVDKSFRYIGSDRPGTCRSVSWRREAITRRERIPS